MSLVLKPLRGRILVKIDEFRYSGRIVVPDKAKRLPTTGVVIDCGEGVSQVEVGQTVVYGLYSGTALKFKGEPTYRVLTEDEILCIKEGEAELDHDTPQE